VREDDLDAALPPANQAVSDGNVYFTYYHSLQPEEEIHDSSHRSFQAVFYRDDAGVNLAGCYRLKNPVKIVEIDDARIWPVLYPDASSLL
jgi:hypothetical protein